MSLTLGHDPESLSVRVPRDASWWAALRHDDGDWPDDAVLRLVFAPVNGAPGPTWTATITGDLATWNRTAADVNGLVDRQRVDLVYITNGPPILWARGRVVQYA